MMLSDQVITKARVYKLLDWSPIDHMLTVCWGCMLSQGLELINWLTDDHMLAVSQ